MSFTHLHVHTEYSLLDGACRINDILDFASEQGMKSLAITDHGVVQAYPEAVGAAGGKIKIFMLFGNALRDALDVKK